VVLGHDSENQTKKSKNCLVIMDFHKQTTTWKKDWDIEPYETDSILKWTTSTLFLIFLRFPYSKLCSSSLSFLTRGAATKGSILTLIDLGATNNCLQDQCLTALLFQLQQLNSSLDTLFSVQKYVCYWFLVHFHLFLFSDYFFSRKIHLLVLQ
jgi:hypothetical protein